MNIPYSLSSECVCWLETAKVGEFSQNGIPFILKGLNAIFSIYFLSEFYDYLTRRLAVINVLVSSNQIIPKKNF